MQTDDKSPARRSPAEDRLYYGRRADDHERLAAASRDDGARILHQQFATAYRERIAALPMVEDD